MIIVAGVILLVASYSFIRSQALVSDGAILMCREASLRDLEIRRLCENIQAGQQAEIEQMKAILARLD